MSDIYTMPGHLIRRLNQISASIFQDRMAAMGLDLTSVQYAALSTLAKHPGIDQATLAGMIAYDHPLVARITSARDRRARELALTDSGAALLERVHPEVLAIQPAILSGLSDDERALFMTLAARAAEAGNDRSRAPLRHRTDN